jgi:TolB-like protein
MGIVTAVLICSVGGSDDPDSAVVCTKLLVGAAVIGLASLPIAAGCHCCPLTLPAAHFAHNARLRWRREPAHRPTSFNSAAPSIIVLPFINLSGFAKKDYVADGFTDSIIIYLAGALSGTCIVSLDTAFTYKDRSLDARQIGRELEVRYALEGSVALEGERVRVNVRLVETKEGSQLWAERFDTERKSILQVQDEVVGRVSRAIGLKGVDIEARRSRLERPSSTELVDLILRGKAALNLPSSPASMIEARGLFEQALEIQPTDVDGLAGVASTLVFEFLNGYYETEGDKRLQRAEQLLDRASTIEPRHLMALKARRHSGARRASSMTALPPLKPSSWKIPANRGPTRKSACRPCISADPDRPSIGSRRPIASARATRVDGPGWTVGGTLSFCSDATRRPSAR